MGSQKKEKNTESKQEEIKDERETQLRNALVQVGYHMMKPDGRKSGNEIDPTVVKSAIDNKTPQFVGYRQHDAHEFLATLLDLLHEEIKDANKTEEVLPKNESDKKADKSGKKQKKKKVWNRLPPLFGGVKRASNFSQLDSAAISDLLHGNSNNDDSSC